MFLEGRADFFTGELVGDGMGFGVVTGVVTVGEGMEMGVAGLVPVGEGVGAGVAGFVSPAEGLGVTVAGLVTGIVSGGVELGILGFSMPLGTVPLGTVPLGTVPLGTEGDVFTSGTLGEEELLIAAAVVLK